MGQDLRYALRSLLANRGITLLAMLCLSLGIGVNAMIFSTVDGTLLRPFPYRDPERIVGIRGTNPGAGITRSSLSYKNMRDVQEQARSFESVAGVSFRNFAIGGGAGEPERVRGALVTANLFSLIGIRPALGRDFLPSEDRPNVAAVAIIADDLWLRRYNRDRSVLGQPIIIDAKPYTVIGIMPEHFKFPELQEVWIPIDPVLHDASRSRREVRVFARLEPGVSIERATEDVRSVAARLEREFAVDNRGWSMFARALREEFIPQQISIVLWTMMGAVSLVLLIACANVANLLLARATSRSREIAVRTAIGAARWHVVRQLLVESVLIAVVSVPLGIALARLGLLWIDNLIPRTDALPYYVTWSLDGRSLAYLVTVSVLTGFLFGLAPALQAIRSDVVHALKEGARGSGAGAKRNRIRNALVVAEIAMSLILLIGAALFVRSFLSLRNSPDGFDVTRLMTMRFYLSGDAYEEEGAKERRVEDIARRVEALPGVQAVTVSNLIPRDGGGRYTYVQIEGRAYERSRSSQVLYAGVTPGFLKTLDVPLLRGRNFTGTEGISRSGVAVVSERLATKYWQDGDPVGRRFALNTGESDDDMTWFTVIGVAREFAVVHIGNEPPDVALVPYPYMEVPNNGLIVRVASGDPAAITAAVRREIRQADENIPLFNAMSMSEARKLSYWEWELFGAMFAAFGVVALVLAAIGVYGVLSYSVSQRTHEIGVRVALGAAAPQVLRLIVMQGMKLACVGVAVGLAGALAITQLIRSVLVVSPTDPVSFAGIAIFLTGVAFLASYLPARRALTVDPVIALRDQ